MCLSERASKILLFIINIFFFLLALGAILLGALMLVEDDKILGLLSRVPLDTDVIEQGLFSLSWLDNFAYMMLVAGAALFFICGAGLFGALCRSPCLLTIYGTLVTLILLVEVSAGVIAILYTDRVETFLITFLTECLQKYYVGMEYDTSNGITLSNDESGVSDGFDYVHVEFKCCGVNNYTDFTTYADEWPGYYTLYGTNVTAMVPPSCCVMDDYSKFPDQLSEVSFTNITECIVNANSTYTNQQGCYQAVKDEILTYGYAFIAIGIVFGILVQVLGLWGAISLYKAITNSKVTTV